MFSVEHVLEDEDTVLSVEVEILEQVKISDCESFPLLSDIEKRSLTMLLSSEEFSLPSCLEPVSKRKKKLKNGVVI